MARALVAEGYLRTDTFADFCSATPTLLKKLTGAEKAAAMLRRSARIVALRDDSRKS